jgi:ketosteroid isomerase-like protein
MIQVNGQANERTVQQFFACFGQGDIPGVVALLTADVEWQVAGRPEIMPWAGRRRGRDQVALFLTILPETVEIQRFEPRVWIEGRGTVIVLGHEQSRVKSTDRTCTTDWVMVFTFRDGLIANFQEYHDTAAWVAAYARPVTE